MQKLFSRKKQADISPDFREERRSFPVKVHQNLNEWCTIKKIEKNNGESYFFMERKGVDSVAFMLLDRNRGLEPFGLIEQFRGNFGEFQVGCYTGSLDKELSLVEHVIEEVREESGFEVTPDRVVYVSTECAGSQSNERVHLYLVDVTGLPQLELQPESDFEVNTNNLWKCDMGVIHCDDWKAKLILLSCLRTGVLLTTNC